MAEAGSTEALVEALRGEVDAVPWAALDALAERAGDASVRARLLALYDETAHAPTEQPSFEWLLVPGVFQLAAPRLDDAAARELALYFLADLPRCHPEDDFLFETIQYTIGKLGPRVLPEVTAAARAAGPDDEAWSVLWSLLSLTAETERAEWREPAIELARGVLREALEGRVDAADAAPVAWMLRDVRDSGEGLGLLKRLRDRTANAKGGLLARQPHVEFRHAAQEIQQARASYEPSWATEAREQIDVTFDAARKAWARAGADEGDGDAYADEFDDVFDDGGVDNLARSLLAKLQGAPVEEDEPTPSFGSGAAKLGRNEPCPCGSGKKYKKCCGKAG